MQAHAGRYWRWARATKERTTMTTTATESAPYVLFVGETATAQALQQTLVPMGGDIYHSHSLMETLGMYITIMPRIIVIDTCAPFAAEAYLHLRSVEARPILLLTDPDGFTPAREASVSWLPRTASNAEQVRAICRLAAQSSAFNTPFVQREYLDEAIAFAN
ncbi:MAG: hypothetical protein SGI73_20965 [Chloroflexota bacterium]|nr:hypothetical protein [Chloroflexota bacterium]